MQTETILSSFHNYKKDTEAVLEMALLLLKGSFYSDEFEDEEVAQENCEVALELLEWHLDNTQGKNRKLNAKTSKFIDEFAEITSNPQ